VDLTAYRPAKEFLGEDVPTYKALRRVLRENPHIRTRKPGPQRLEVHAGDWAAWKARHAVNTARRQRADCASKGGDA